MKKIKNIITGILSVAVFFMAVQVGVAQEKVAMLSGEIVSQPAFDVLLFSQSADTVWFSVTITGIDETLPTNQEVTAQANPSGTCQPPYSGPICSVKLDKTNMPSSNQAAYDALIDRIGGGNPPTISEFLALGITSVQYAKTFDPDQDGN
ncbi:hypothetical protein [Parapedobacter sp. 10938]|uniref:hypothetical protein n=1 Tax=Parapedobacter flavus TaxID=3110225 RepID=UPI002DB990E5|nr:hypothetical protein [Parapedobacter sp. 10938]MEC3879136.1 hypothetical protein [Parapedobacter sp. 10938]